MAYIERLDEAHVDAQVDAAELRRRFATPLPVQGMDPVDVIDELVANVEGGLTASTGGRFFGWVIGGSLPAAMAADWLTSTWDQVPGIYRVSPAGSVVEEVCGAWLKELLNLPAEASFGIVTGCQMAHVTALAAARNSLLQRQGWDVEKQGLFGAPRLRVLTSAHRHGTIDRALRMLGVGIDCIVEMPLDAAGQIRADALEENLAAHAEVPAILLLQAGNVNTGVFDKFAEVIPIARKFNAWVHVDGAFGLWAQTSPDYKHLTRGMEMADSWATDGHKWLNVPYDCGYAFVRDSEAHRRTFGHKAHYLGQTEDNREAIDWAPEHSRRARGFATYAAIKSLGSTGIGEMITRHCRQAALLFDLVKGLPNVEIIQYPIINQGILRFLDPTPGATDADHDRRTDAVMDAISASGEALFTGTLWNDQRCMRVSVSSWRTTDEDIRRAARAIAAATLPPRCRQTG